MTAQVDAELSEFEQLIADDAEQFAFDIVRLAADAVPADQRRAASTEAEILGRWPLGWTLFDS